LANAEKVSSISGGYRKSDGSDKRLDFLDLPFIFPIPQKIIWPKNLEFNLK
jgi:hypothetical protein